LIGVLLFKIISREQIDDWDWLQIASQQRDPATMDISGSTSKTLVRQRCVLNQYPLAAE